jgi:cyclic 2,3-diphosphoglycerate synthetase
LRDDLAGADADVFLVELKAAAVDVVAEEAARRGVRIVIASNDVVPLPGEPSLDVELDRLASETLSFASEAVQ